MKRLVSSSRTTKTAAALIAAVLIGLSAAPQAGAQAAPTCFAPAQTQQMVQTGQVLPLSEAVARGGVSGQVLRAELCNVNGRLVYRLTVLGAGGQVQTAVTLDAVTGQRL